MAEGAGSRATGGPENPRNRKRLRNRPMNPNPDSGAVRGGFEARTPGSACTPRTFRTMRHRRQLGGDVRHAGHENVAKCYVGVAVCVISHSPCPPPQPPVFPKNSRFCEICGMSRLWHALCISSSVAGRGSLGATPASPGCFRRTVPWHAPFSNRPSRPTKT